MRTRKFATTVFGAALLMAAPLKAATISVNFRVGGDADAQADHELTGAEAAGLDGNTVWNNINVGVAGLHKWPGTIFGETALADDGGDAHAATLAVLGRSTWFVGYASGNAKKGAELGLSGHHDDLFNSYLALGSDDDAVLQVSGLDETYTQHGYQVIIYSDSDKVPDSKNIRDRQSVFTLTPEGGAALTAFVEDDSAATRVNTFDGAYIAGDSVDDGAEFSNYSLFSNLSASSFTLQISSPDGMRGAISGFQIVAAQEQKTLGLIVAAVDPVSLPLSKEQFQEPRES